MSKYYDSEVDLVIDNTRSLDAGKRAEGEIEYSMVLTELLLLRLSNNLSQKQIADAMQCDPSKVSKMESGNDLNLKWGDILGYLKALGASPKLFIEAPGLPVSEQIRRQVRVIGELLRNLAALSGLADDDPKLIARIDQFYREVLFVYLERHDPVHGTIPAAKEYTTAAEPSKRYAAKKTRTKRAKK